ncbi:minor capsid protein [uncultured Eubacterium sp.]|uniref:minor capsid protein n=1 Tax=uncultured Eubacterium sp. TaxID=165185 RepID=UPI00259252D6|nr:minor capsid protein [uncultured Eubacterium sp.]
MKNSEYWKNRFVEMEEATHQTSVKKTMDIQEQFDKSQKIIEEKINAWYQRYADNNNMSLLEARKSLNDKELKELKWDVEEYIKKGRENAFSGEWVKELENASAKAHISRLEALELQCRQQAEVAFGNLNDEVSKHIKDVYKKSYYKTAYEIQKGVGVGSNFAALNDRLIEKVVNKPWLADGKNFSDRIWGNKTQLINQLHTSLSQMCITGSGPDKAISQIASKMNVSKANAGRLVMTESAYFSSTAQKECFKELDVERYEIVATLDGHTSDICQEMDGKVFKMSEYEEGVTAPPFHVNCRSCTAPYFDDEFAKGERIARNEDGDTYYVPDDITYKEWKNTLKNDRFYEAEKTSSRRENLQVKWNNVNNPEYKRKFSNITSSEGVNNKLYEKAIDILKHRNGTDYEDFYLIDMRSGEVKASQTKVEYTPDIEEELKHNRVWYNKEIKREIRNNPPKTFITIHNHSHNMPPSGGDFKGAFKNNYYAGINICYNGDIYYYKVGKKKFTEEMYDLTVAKYRNRGYNEIEAYEATLNQFVKEYGIKWRKL